MLCTGYLAMCLVGVVRDAEQNYEDRVVMGIMMNAVIWFYLAVNMIIIMH